MKEGVTDFYAGGAKGWDTIFADYDEKNARSGTGQTVRLAEKQGKEIINILKL